MSERLMKVIDVLAEKIEDLRDDIEILEETRVHAQQNAAQDVAAAGQCAKAASEREARHMDAYNKRIKELKLSAVLDRDEWSGMMVHAISELRKIVSHLDDIYGWRTPKLKRQCLRERTDALANALEEFMKRGDNDA
jgi:hypothetical protein